MVQYGADLLQNALDLGWQTAKGSYKVLLTQIESTSLTWENINEIQALRHQFAQRSIMKQPSHVAHVAPSAPLHNYGPRNVRRVLCNRFQNNTCAHETDHSADGVRYRHICAYCFHQLGKTFPHKECECQNKRRGRGNGQGGPPPQ